MGFGQRLLSLRKEKGMSQDELGGQLNVSRQTVSKWELGETTPEMDKLISISELFNISLDKLVKGIDTPDFKAEDKNICVDKSDTRKKGIYKIVLLVVIIFGVIFLVDLISMIVYFISNGFPT